MSWDAERISGPDGEDWRVPVPELEGRQARLSRALAEAGTESVLIDDPVELYWLTGGRQSSLLLIGAEGSGISNTQWVSRSLRRACYEAGGDDSPHSIEARSKMSEFGGSLVTVGCTRTPGMLGGKVPKSRWSFLSSKMGGLGGESEDCTGMLYALRETKSEWELEMHRESGRILSLIHI